MKAIILAAGQGRRLLPLTHTMPKSLISLGGRTILEWQLNALAANGIHDVIMVTGFAADHITDAAKTFAPEGMRIDTVYNPFYGVSDNIASCWAARSQFTGDLLLMNGDTIFGPELLAGLLKDANAPITAALDQKANYDADDVKVSLDNGKIRRIGKTLSAAEMSAEAVGLYVMKQNAAQSFIDRVDSIMQRPRGVVRWYFSAIDELAAQGMVHSHLINGLPWAEVDYPGDIVRAERTARVLARGNNHTYALAS